MRRVFIILTLLGAPTFVFAAPYYEFAPDYSEPLTVNVGATVSQKFAPLNDRLVGIDLWVGTGGQTASIDVTLRNASGAAVSSRTLALGAIADVTGGTRRSITLNSQISVSGGETYTLDIVPSGAPVRLYRSTSVSIAPGSGSGSSSGYLYGAAIVNGEEQGYSFKFALTEAGESTAPGLSDVQVSQPAIGSALVSFTASEPVDVQIVYGSRTVGWTGQYSPCLSGISRCSVYLRTTPGITYSYSLSLKDSWGNVTSTQSSFTAVGAGPSQETPTPSVSMTATPTGQVTATPTPTQTVTPPPQEDDPPIIINPRLLGLSPTSATVAWTTDEAANTSVIMIGEGKYAFDTTLELEHYITITGLIPDHYYRMRVSSADYWGNYSDVILIFITPLTAQPTTTVLPSPGATVTPTPAPSFTVILPSESLAPPTTPPPSSSSPTATATAGQPTGTAPTSSATPTPSVVVYPSTSTGPGVITWDPPGGGGGVDGYRIDIFDENNVLITSITVDANTTSIPLPGGIPRGARIIVYADHDGAFEKVGDPAYITERPPAAGASYATSVIVIGGGVVLLAVLMWAWIRERRKQRLEAHTETSIGLGSGSQAGR